MNTTCICKHVNDKSEQETDEKQGNSSDGNGQNKNKVDVREWIKKSSQIQIIENENLKQAEQNELPRVFQNITGHLSQFGFPTLFLPTASGYSPHIRYSQNSYRLID